MLDGRFDPALALLLTEQEPAASDLPHPLAILIVAGITSVFVMLGCFSFLGG